MKGEGEAAHVSKSGMRCGDVEELSLPNEEIFAVDKVSSSQVVGIPPPRTRYAYRAYHRYSHT